MKSSRRLSEIIEALEDRGIDPDDVIVDRRAIRVIVSKDNDESDVIDED